jgi:phosphate ABC transporter permease protein PstC
MNEISKRLTLHLPMWITAGMALVALLCISSLFLYLVIESIPILKNQGLQFFTGRSWWPGEVYGALPMIFGSLMVTGLALIFVLPFALGAAILTSEFLSSRSRLWVKAMMELLAGIPGIIYGLIGVSLLAPWVRNAFNLIDGNTLLTAGILLAVMILPTIMTLAEDSLHGVPGEFRQSALSLGMTRWQMVRAAVLPNALPGIAGAVFLGLGRAMGETIAVMLVIGGLDRIPVPWFDIFSPGQSIASKLGREAAESIGSGLHWNALIGLGLVLFLLVLALTWMGNSLIGKTAR